MSFIEGEIETIVSIGGIYENLGEFREAKAKYKYALSKAESAKDDIAKANVLNSLAALFHAQDKYKDADRYLSEAKTLTANEVSKEAKTHHANTSCKHFQQGHICLSSENQLHTLVGQVASAPCHFFWFIQQCTVWQRRFALRYPLKPL